MKGEYLLKDKKVVKIMKKYNKNTKVLAIVALLVAVVGTSIAFAAFTASLTIKPSAEVTGDASKFNVGFSTASGSIKAGTVAGSVLPDGSGTAAGATLAATTISGLKANFTKETATATYSFYVHNAGAIGAYLTNVAFSKAKPTCTAKTGSTTNTTLLNAACSKVTIKVNVNDTDYSKTTAVTGAPVLAAGSSIPIKVTISAAAGSRTVDGDYTVDFGDITLTYSSKQ